MVRPVISPMRRIPQILWKYVLYDLRGVVGLSIIALFIALSIAAPQIARNDPNALVAESYHPPSPSLIMGADYFGRDLFSRLIWGTVYTMVISALASTLIVSIGLVMGAISGYIGGWVDEVFMRLTDIFLLIPSFFVFLILSAYVPPNNYLAALVLGILSWPSTARIIRSQVVVIKGSPYVEAAIAIGAGPLRIIVRHIIPNMIPLIVVSFIQDLIYSVHAITTLIFLGLGDIKQPTWGETLYWAFTTGAIYRDKWWAIAYPSIFIVIYSLALIMINEAINKRIKEG
ncbi:MAG: ABC transporter permease [Sulfolobales archaeon]